MQRQPMKRGEMAGGIIGSARENVLIHGIGLTSILPVEFDQAAMVRSNALQDFVQESSANDNGCRMKLVL